MQNQPKITIVKKQVRSGSIRNYSKGSRKLYITKFDSDNSYEADGTWVEGLIELNITLASEITNIGADDNPNYISLTSPTTGSGTIKITGMPIEALKYIANVEVTEQGVIYGSDVALPHCAFKYEERLSDGSTTRVIMFDSTLSLNSITAKTDDGKTIKDCTINVSIAPVEYLALDGTTKTVTLFTTNSKANPNTFASFSDSIQYPSYELLHGGGESHAGNIEDSNEGDL